MSTRTRFMNNDNSRALKVSLRRLLEEARRETDALFAIVHPSALYDRPIEERHRIIFYLGHLEAFDWNMVCRASFNMKPLHSEFEHLFAFGIDPVGGGLPQDKASDWPSLEKVQQYIGEVRQAVDDCLDRVDFSSDRPYVKSGLIFWVALEHRLMHLETLSYMLHWLRPELKQHSTTVVADMRPRPRSSQVSVPAGIARLGANRNDERVFGWDNEFQGHFVEVPEFEIDIYKVSNGDFVEFVNAGGYQERSFWTNQAWNWITGSGIRHPKFWIKRKEQWWYRAMFGEIPLPESWPVYVSHAEASAYAQWRGKVLPTEAEFHRAAFGNLNGTSKGAHPRDVPVARGNFGLQRWNPTPVDFVAESAAPLSPVEMVGNGWEWTSSYFAPFPQFEAFPFYSGYSADFFDNKHFVLKGASPRTASRLSRPSFRNWFQPHYPHIYAGFRCVQR
jgi:iron(II)-dependent oxidoreductase